MKITKTPYKGAFTEAQQAEILALLWDYMQQEPGFDRVQTGYGTKTQTGLLASLEGIVYQTKEATR